MSPVPPIKLPEEQFAALETAYAKPPRAYHDFNHVREVLRHHVEVAAGPGWAQPAETFLAVLYHDAVYEAGRGDNETRSAELAVAEIAKWLPEASVDASRVAELIELTRSEEHTSELQSLMRISYAVFCLQKKNIKLI